MAAIRDGGGRSWLQFVMAGEDHGCNLLPPGCRKLEKERSRVDGNRRDFREREQQGDEEWEW
ncbi:hypothetical protein AMTR_s00034p00082180 [Amborella trichopoda]|uniref:Uncharacterized protein n=1 Tax=Amborella trichopoda TaxID=13333 RepID=W1PVT4_AMBTC|nr:hypothetical protein AMTR_s00034p00082180 [Amborella trichopoda]